MGREASITFDQVSVVADDIVAKGGKPSLKNIREVLGRGSFGTITKLLQEWRDEKTRQSQLTEDSLAPSITRALSQHIAERVLLSVSESTNQIVELRGELNAVLSENKQMNSDINLLEAEISLLKEQRAAQAGRIQQLESDALVIGADLATERSGAEGIRLELVKSTLRLEAVPKIEAEIKKVNDEILQYRNLAASNHEAAAVANAKLVYEIEQRKISEKNISETADRVLAKANEALNNARAEMKKYIELAAILRNRLSEARKESEAEVTL